MLPWGHLAFGYLVYTAGTRLRNRRPPAGVPTLAMALGTQLPDLVDKPLNWWFGVFDGRAVGHSLVTLVPLCALVALVVRRHDRGDLAGGFSVGALTHLLGDSYGAFFAGQFDRASFLVWPLLPAPTYPSDGLADHLRRWVAELEAFSAVRPVDLLASPFGAQFVSVAALVAVWAYDGFPGVATLRRLIGRVGDRR